jgi:diguanylate cyclase (GGDEF)-like protein
VAQVAERVGGGSTGFVRRAAYGSVWHYLVTLALIPVLGLLPFVGLLITERLKEASTAGRVARDLSAVEALDRLRIAVTEESMASAMTLLGRRFQLPVQQLNTGLGLPLSVPQARKSTDQTLAAVPLTPIARPLLTGFEAKLAAVRRTFDATSRPDRALQDAWTVGSDYIPVGHQIADAQQRTADLVATGEDGVTGSRLLRDVHQLKAVADLVVSGDQQATLFYLTIIAPDDQRGVVNTEMDRAQQDYRVRAGDLPRDLSAGIARTWRGLTVAQDTNTFLSAIPKLRSLSATLPSGGSAALSLPELRSMIAIIPAAKAITHFTQQLSSFLRDAVQEAAGRARADHARARRLAVESAAASGVLLFLTGTVLIVVGGTLRGRLRELAAGAQRLSAGNLDLVPVHGPRELAATSEAINDAVASLREVEAKAELLAAGDLGSPELEEPAPGPLGAAVHASVARIVTTVREREELRRRLSHQAAHDGLTGLVNRAEIERRLVSALARAERDGTIVGVLFVDLDRFKECNDRLGHAAGDHVLRVVAERMLEEVRRGDTVGRLGGDEFVVVIEATSHGRLIMEIAQRIVAALGRPIEYEGQLARIGGSVGLSLCQEGPADAEQLLHEADSAVYQAKAAGGGVVVVYDELLRKKLRQEQDLEAGLAAALAREEFVLYYQPIVDVANERLRGFEALIRWERPGVGLVTPNDFIPVAENSELIIDIGRWALGEATRQLVAWSAEPGLSGLDVSVNLSGRHLINPCVPGDVRTALENSGLDPGRLIVEITETAPMNSLVAVDHLRELSRLGVRIALDDFGTGHTSINQLLNLPIDIVKIDRSFVSGHGATIRSERGSRSVAELLIQMAHGLNLTVVAEGVEQDGQLAGLVDSQCDDAQGFLFSRPLPAAQAPDWVRGRLESERTSSHS